MKASGYYFVYIISNATRTTIYIGITNDLERRLYEHRSKEVRGFSARYRLTDLVYHESFPDPASAIAREKQLKGWRREKKEKLIERLNPRLARSQRKLERGPVGILNEARHACGRGN